MDFGLSEEQRLLEETIRRYLDTEAPITRVREIVETATGHDRPLWEELAELGVAGILVPEEHGGSDLTLLDAAVAAESLASAVAPTGRVTSYDLRPDILTLARRNLENLGVADLVTLYERDIAEGFLERGVDALFLDVPAPCHFLPQSTPLSAEAVSLGPFSPRPIKSSSCSRYWSVRRLAL